MDKQPTVLSATEKQLIEDDKKLSHAVFFVDCSVRDEIKVEDEIENGLCGLRDRAEKADMVMLASNTNQSVYFDEADGCGHVCVSIICTWAQREVLERSARQQQLAGQPVDPRFKGVR